MTPTAEIAEMVDRETRAWDTQDVDLLLTLFHPDMVWPWPPTARDHDPATWVLAQGRFDAERWRAGWQTLFDTHTLVHNRRQTRSIVLSDEGDGAFAVVDVDTLWRNAQGRDFHWKGRACKIYTRVGGAWKMIAHIGLLDYDLCRANDGAAADAAAADAEVTSDAGAGPDGVRIHGPQSGQAGACEPILRALPDWFGIEAALADYVRAIDALPTWIATAGDGADRDEVVGFLTLKQHGPAAAELYVMGVRPAMQRRGVGRALVRAAEAYLRARGTTFLQVKTLSPRHPDPHYARTRRFYEAMGFQPLEEFPELWGAANPCLQMIKALSPAEASSGAA